MSNHIGDANKMVGVAPTTEESSGVRASTAAALGIDLEQFRDCVTTTRTIALQEMSNALNRGAEQAAADAKRDIGECDRLLALIDASPKCGNTPAPRIELTNGQIAQLADFAGTPVAGTPLDEQDVLVIQHADAGHSGPGLYAHYDELPEEGAIYLDGQLPASPKGGDGAITDSSRLDFIAGEFLHIEPVEIRASEDDADAGWVISQYHMGKGLVELIRWDDDNLLSAITAALRAAPEGVVMVPVEPTEELTLRIAKALQASEQSGWTWEDCSPIEVDGWMELATAAIAAMLAVRPQGASDA